MSLEPQGRSVVMTSRIVVAATFLAVLVIAFVQGHGLASLQGPPTNRTAFFEQLMAGGADKGLVYLEIRLKNALLAAAKTPPERWAVWKAFFSRVLREEPTLAESKSVPYWGDFAYQRVDWSSVAAAADVHVGDVLRVRTPTSDGSVRVVRYAIHYNAPGDANLLLAVAQPLTGFKVPDTDVLFAASRIPRCEGRCPPRTLTPDARMLENIRKVVAVGARIPDGQQIKHITALEGRFTRPARQYVVYVDFGTDSDTNLKGYWRTVILDSDLSIIGVVGENEYTHIEPRSVGDVDGDGLDEVWVNLFGYEGRHAGLIYWRGHTGRDAFGVIANAYNGA